MKILGGILIIVSLVAASISASVAYHVSVDRADDELLGLTLQDEQDLLWLADDQESNSPAAAEDVTDVQKQLTPERIQMLRDRARGSTGRSAKYVRVREFAISRWPAKWTFVLACLGMVVGALLQRWSASPSQGIESRASRTSPQDALTAIAEKLDQLVQAAGDTAEDQEACRQLILAGADELQKQWVPAFVETYPLLVVELGMGRAAEMMDAFAGAERLINRAWSASCDGAVDEAMDCMVRAKRRMDEILTPEIVDP